METYINGLSCISHYSTFLDAYFFEDANTVPKQPTLFIADPNYKDYIPAATIRRTSHILKMGISAGLMCLKNAGDQQPDAIITGTAMGCFEDTDKFLRSMDEHEERMLTPTAFIQSTHNTVAGQLALLLKCHDYNFTYVHQELSFEFALNDALMLLEEGEAKNVLVGGVDELIPPLVEMFSRAGHVKAETDLGTPLHQSTTKGYIAGEGAAFFLLSPQKANDCHCQLRGVKTVANIHNAAELSNFVDTFLSEMGLQLHDIQVLFTGINGDVGSDALLHEYSSKLPQSLASFKNLCGEYFTASAFALWLASRCIEKQMVPAAALYRGQSPASISHILILNHYQGNTYSAMCLSKC